MSSTLLFTQQWKVRKHGAFSSFEEDHGGGEKVPPFTHRENIVVRRLGIDRLARDIAPLQGGPFCG